MRQPLSKDDILNFHRTLSNWGRWGAHDQLGTLNLITPEKRVAAARLVQSGRTVSCARPLPTIPGPDNMQPVVHLMTATASEGYGGDYVALAPHGYSTSHLDALCHIFQDGRLYNGYPAARVTARGALELGIDALRDGIVTRGVLLDAARARGADTLEPGEPIYVDDLERAEESAGVRVGEGDVLLLHTGRWRHRDEHGAWKAHERLAGLDASCLPWLHERGIAALGCDGVSDVLPSRIADVTLPIHSVAIVALGLHLIDNLELGPLAQACEAEQRWEFFLTVAPLVLERGTASPVNPIATF
ncbi:cyclase family protein [Candidatus Binatia bacterium]|nr:cyclase family protein [Candidatus Binatia bacterium]